MLRTYNCEDSDINLYSHHYVPNDFNPHEFDKSIPHTMTGWQHFFFSISEDAKLIDRNVECPVIRNNIHARAFVTYLKKKQAKNLVIGFDRKFKNKKPKGFGK
ncbi:MAG: hypothetical protein AAF208_06675 [Cyanobacteria bacterium P01_A01_bin.45]